MDHVSTAAAAIAAIAEVVRGLIAAGIERYRIRQAAGAERLARLPAGSLIWDLEDGRLIEIGSGRREHDDGS